ncbi:MAG TPA: glycerophosphodiester phosphodiesterase [Gemmatirosa sp.]|nr:glycerophosphodiester phosphodiesterase [Gemmatirosa sp.]
MILLDPQARPIVAHRGESAHAPENTLVAFERAVRLGVDALEFDVRVTADDVPVVHHDPTLDRTTDASGPLRARPLAALRACDAGARFSPDGGRTHPFRGQAVRVPTLDEVLGAFSTVPLLIELKEAAAAGPARAVLDRHRAADRVVVASFVDEAVAPFRGTAYRTGASQRDAVRLLQATLLGRPVRPTYAAASLPPRWRGVPLPIAGFARALRAAGVPLHVWTVDDAGEARRLWAAGVSGIISNDPATMLPVRGRSH